MKRIYLTALYLLLILCNSSAQQDKDLSSLWNTANKAYDQKDYDYAIGQYQKILLKDSSNAPAYYNLGNSYFKKNEIALAVLNYERALFYDPDMQDALTNKKIAQARTGKNIHFRNKIFFLRWWEKLSQGQNCMLWSLIAFISFFLLISLYLLHRLQRLRSPFQVFVLLTCTSIVSVGLAWISSVHLLHSDKAVVMKANATFKSDIEGAKEIIIPEATSVTMSSNVKGAWVMVDLPDGRSGWVLQSSISPVLP